MNEHSFVSAIHRKLRGDPRIDIWKIHDQYAGGVPDAVYFGNKGTIWVEYKYIKQLPKKDDTLINLCHSKYLSPLQQSWLERKHLLNTRIAVIVGSPCGHQVFEGLDWKNPTNRTTFMNAMDINDIVKYLTNIVHEA